MGGFFDKAVDALDKQPDPGTTGCGGPLAVKAQSYPAAASGLGPDPVLVPGCAPVTRIASNRAWMVMVAAAVLAALRLAIPERGLEEAGPHALANSAFSIGLLLLVAYAAQGVGRILLRWLRCPPIDPLLGLVFSIAVGLGILAYGVLGLGLIGLLRPAAVFVWLGLATIAAVRESAMHAAWPDPLLPFRRLSLGLKAALGAAMAIFGLSLIQALTPVWDHDGLMYHLQGPALFLKAQRLTLLPDLWQANGPLSAEMLYLLGLAAGSETFSKVLHLATAALLVIATFAVARRHLGDRAGWLAGGILLGIPILPVWGTLAYADMTWALFEFLAVAAYLEWRAAPQRGWILVAGVMLGLAMGSKYTGLALLPVLVLALLLDPVGGRGSRQIRFALELVGVSVLVASPWYLKNLWWAGNPVYPFLFGGPGWPKARMEMLLTYLQSFGTGRSVLDYLLLPISLLTQRAAFGTFMSRIDIPKSVVLARAGLPASPTPPRVPSSGLDRAASIRLMGSGNSADALPPAALSSAQPAQCRDTRSLGRSRRCPGLETPRGDGSGRRHGRGDAGLSVDLPGRAAALAGRVGYRKQDRFPRSNAVRLPGHALHRRFIG